MGEVFSVRDIISRMEWEQGDKENLIQLWVQASIAAPMDQAGKKFFQSLIRQTRLTNQFRAQMADPFNGHADSDARTLFDWARGRGVNPADPKFTTLGSVMYPTLFQFGMDEARLMAALMVKYKLIVDPEERRRFAIRFQIPSIGAAPSAGQEAAQTQIAVGPDFTWKGSNDEIELQGLFRPDPIDLDVGFLVRAIAATSGVCRIEINDVPMGTGFLVAPDLVVTNYHVLGKSDAEVDAAALGVALHFGAMTNQQAQEDQGQKIPVDVSNPVVSRSPIEVYDFVVLRADSSIYDCKGLKPTTLRKTNPAEKSGINIIHHSAGEAMRLQFSPRGISTVMAPEGKLQYASRTTGGSSGSPCFDDDFAVIAIHHAARSTGWGVAGEGILISTLYELIKPYLDGGG